MLQAEDSAGEGRPPLALPPSATEAADQIIGILECLKQYDLVKTITANNGLQFAEHERVSRVTDVGFFLINRILSRFCFIFVQYFSPSQQIVSS